MIPVPKRSKQNVRDEGKKQVPCTRTRMKCLGILLLAASVDAKSHYCRRKFSLMLLRVYINAVAKSP
jgi:hypothetical protein